MPRKPHLHKGPVALPIDPHQGEYSPHLLDLRSPKFSNENLNGQDHKTPSPSFEEKIAAFDERLKEMPDLLKSRALEFSQWQAQWSQGLNNAWGNALRWGTQAQKKFKTSELKSRIPLINKARVQPWLKIPELAFLVLLVLLVTLPLQAFLLHRTIAQAKFVVTKNWSESITALESLKGAAAKRDLAGAQTALNNLAGTLGGLREQFERLGPLKIFLPSAADAAFSMLKIGEQGTLALGNISREFLQAQRIGQAGMLLRALNQEVIRLKAQLNTLAKNDSSEMLAALRTQLNTLEDFSLISAELFGSQTPRKILLVFQNPRELRATGGFAGSFALLTLRDGKIENVETPEGGTYAIQGQLPLARISPQPLHLINSRFEFQDANWWPDFPTSARKIVEFYEMGGGGTLDAVLAVNATFGEELLRLNGPIVTDEGEISADNFIDTLQTAIARDRVADRKAPKKVIAELLPALTQVLMNTAREHPKELITTLYTLAQRKDIQLWTRDEKWQAAVERLGFDGGLKETSGDYLAVITANVGGGKTDGVVSETIDHQSTINYSENSKTTGQLTARTTVKITRTHQGLKRDPFTGHPNRAYLRVYVPEKARLLSVLGNDPPPSLTSEKTASHLTPDPQVRAYESQIKIDAASGTEIWQESGKTVFGVWLETNPGENKAITLRYEIPLTQGKELIPYSIMFEPQGGKRSYLTSKVEFGNPLYALISNPAGWQPQSWQYQGSLNRTIIASGLFTPLPR
ncbi:DUF4012 domain-containing protein [Candidatus Uhrbacteria bacterium]|nr:DUF4012 domain-containing protein [Candidatus Uhrbacteria bacterium]